MKTERVGYDALIQSVADGAAVDWAGIDTQMTTDAERRRFRDLRLVARLGELHRTIVSDDACGGDDAEQTGAHTAVVPERWGHLELGVRLGGGAFGDVFLAHDVQLDRDVALKLIRGTASTRRSFEQLLPEARILARVKHTNVVTVHGADVRDDLPGLWMELIKGCTLEESLTARGAFGPAEAQAIGLDLCRALSAVHAAGLVHGDVKAQNVMREDGGRIVLMDFGAGHVRGLATERVVGTPLYLPPEVLAGAPATPQSDIYGLGVLMFHLVTGRYPYRAETLDELREAHAAQRRTRVRDLRPDLPGSMVNVVECALDSDPARRFASAGAMEAALAFPAPPRPVWLPGWLAAVILGLLVGAACVALLMRQPAPVAPARTRVASIAVLPVPKAQPSTDTENALTGLLLDVGRELQRFDVLVKRAIPAGNTPVSSTPVEVAADASIRLTPSPDRRTATVAVIRADGGELWSETIETGAGTLPLLARRLAGEIAVAVGAHERAGVPPPSMVPEQRAYAAYIKGLQLWDQRTPAAVRRSIEYFKQAAALDPKYAEPWAALADAYLTLGVSAFGPLTPLDARRMTKDAAKEALERNPTLAEAHTALAFAAFFHDFDWPTAEAEFTTALQLNPQYPLAHHWYANYLNAMGRQPEAMREIEEAQRLDPLSTIIHRDVGWHLFFQRRYDEAIAQLQETLRRDEASTAARTLLARALAETGRYPEALEQLTLAQPSMPRGTNQCFVAYVQAKSGDISGANDTLKRIRALGDDEYVPPYYIALVYTAEGRAELALTELERSYHEQDSTLVSLKIDPRFDRLRSHPRYQALVRRMRLPGLMPRRPPFRFHKTSADWRFDGEAGAQPTTKSSVRRTTTTRCHGTVVLSARSWVRRGMRCGRNFRGAREGRLTLDIVPCGWES